MDLQLGALQAFYNVSVGTDIDLCLKYNLIIMWNGVDFIKYLFVDPFLSVATVGLIIYKTPLIAWQCYYIYDDIVFMDQQA